MTDIDTLASLATIPAQRGARPDGGATLHDPDIEDQGTRDGAFSPEQRPVPLPPGAGVHSCRGWWTGARTAHCGGCCRHFSSTTAFDRHQRSRVSGVECLDPAKVGLIPVRKPFGVLWSLPVNGSGNPFAASRRGSDDA